MCSITDRYKLVSIPEWNLSIYYVYDTTISSIGKSRLVELLKTDSGTVILANKEISLKVSTHFKTIEGMQKEISNVLSDDIWRLTKGHIAKQNAHISLFKELTTKKEFPKKSCILMEKCGHLYILEGIADYSGPLYCQECER